MTGHFYFKYPLAMLFYFFEGVLKYLICFVLFLFFKISKKMIPALFCLLLGQRAFSYDHHIKNASDLIEFSKNVNNGTNYTGTTVFLDADIDFSGGPSEQFDHIGCSYYFQGTFDGHGHTISSLAIKSSLWYVGLFGNSNRATIRNVVLDSSCSVVSSYNGSSYVGGIIGHCYSCVIENTINMASVSFTGKNTGDYSLILGGIVGYLISSDKDIIVRNCVNYGSVTHTGTAKWAYIGGIVGWTGGDSTNKVFIQNCLNYGTINHNGTTADNSNIGGILGFAYGTCIGNCVSGGKITSNKQAKYNYIGSLVGSSLTVNITHCYWSSNVGNYNPCGWGSPSADTETSQVELNTATVNNLNSYNTSWNKWLLNTNNKTVTFKVNNGKGFNLSSQLILLPSLAGSESHAFSGWFEDDEYTKKITRSSVDDKTTLYGVWSYVVAFDPTRGNATTSSKVVVYGQKYGELPSVTRIGHTFIGWYTEENGGTEVNSTTVVATPSDSTLYAHWTINNYTITFDFGNGTVVNETLKYNETINYPKNLTREGFVFSGWKPKPERMPANDTTVVAQWIENATEWVEITIKKKSMTEEEVKEIIKRYTDKEFTIEKFEDKNEEIRIIIRFTDVEKAKEFIENFKESSDSVAEVIKVRFSFEKQSSLSIETRPHMLAKIIFCFI